MAGVQAAVGPVRESDLAAFAGAKLQLARLRARVNPSEDVPKWREAGAEAFILQLLMPQPSREPVEPHVFVDYFTKDIHAYLHYNVDCLEIHDEPNRTDRGAGVSWQDGKAFADWFQEVQRLLNNRFGDAIAVGFPALAPSTLARPVPSAPMDEMTFLESCQHALASADWAALHLYWRTVEEMRGFDDVMRFLRVYLKSFKDQTFAVTEFANVNPEVPPAARGAQYVEFLSLMAQYDCISAVCGLILRSNDPRYAFLGWLDPDGHPRPLVDKVGGRPRLPDPRKVWMLWPTHCRRYHQRFGENQRLYYNCCRMTGGHNGVDLRVDLTAPETSPIVAALPGTVSQVAFDQDGYGHHLRVRSYGPDGGEITLLYAHLSDIEVEVGMLVSRGDLLGWGGSTGFSSGPHLHLGMRVSGLHMRAVYNWLNPRPYLEMQPRGMPREPYSRTYLLLPPDAGAEWAAAAIRGSWDAHRFTIGGSADDAGIGTLDFRRVIAVNPEAWQSDLKAFFQTHYPGTMYVPVEVRDPESLSTWLSHGPPLPEIPPGAMTWPFGLPRAPYARTYVLLPPDADMTWAEAVVDATWERYRFTLGGSADDAGIGDLNVRRVIAINPARWGGDLGTFFETYYPGVDWVAIQADTPDALADSFAEMDVIEAPKQVRVLNRSPCRKKGVNASKETEAEFGA
jgi:murein DD-endopeptidase MepM/ murein hydrolase activator NlpD